MKSCIYVVALLVFSWIGELHACHDKGHGGRPPPRRSRTKRQTDSSELEEDYTNYLRDFFSNCMRRRAGDIWDWGSVVDVSVLDSQWYRNSDVSNCSLSRGGDSVFCWQLRLNEYLRQTSPFLQDTSDCIAEYNINVTNAAIASRPRSRAKRQTSPQERCTDYHPNSENVRTYGLCNSQNINLSPSRREIDFASVTEFIAEDTICGPEFPDCGANGEETITQGDPLVPRWPYRFEALMRKDTPVRNSVVACNNLVYPVNNPERPCSEWQTWSTCSCSGFSESKRRSRSCPKGSEGEATQQMSCNSECGRNRGQNNFLCNYFLISIFASLGNGGGGLGGGFGNSSSVLPLLSLICQG